MIRTFYPLISFLFISLCADSSAGCPDSHHNPLLRMDPVRNNSCSERTYLWGHFRKKMHIIDEWRRRTTFSQLALITRPLVCTWQKTVKYVILIFHYFMKASQGNGFLSNASVITFYFSLQAWRGWKSIFPQIVATLCAICVYCCNGWIRSLLNIFLLIDCMETWSLISANSWSKNFVLWYSVWWSLFLYIVLVWAGAHHLNEARSEIDPCLRSS